MEPFSWKSHWTSASQLAVCNPSDFNWLWLRKAGRGTLPPEQRGPGVPLEPFPWIWRDLFQLTVIWKSWQRNSPSRRMTRPRTTSWATHLNLAGLFQSTVTRKSWQEELSLQEDDEAQEYLVSHMLEFGGTFQSTVTRKSWQRNSPSRRTKRPRSTSWATCLKKFRLGWKVKKRFP